MPNITLKNRKLFYQDIGKGFPILLGHSYLWDSQMWAPQIEFLSRTFRCIVPDLWAHGQSDSPPSLSPNTQAYPISSLVDDYWSLMQALEIDEFALIGLSVGGMWAGQMALEHPEAVKALVMIGSFLGDEPDASQTVFFNMLDTAEQFKAVPPALQEAIAPYFFADQTFQHSPELVAHFKHKLGNIEPERMSSVVQVGRGIFSRPSLLNQLSGLQVPSLIIAGAEDRSRPPEEAELMQEIIPEAQLNIIDGAGHICNLEQPKTLNAVLAEFLAQSLTLDSPLEPSKSPTYWNL